MDSTESTNNTKKRKNNSLFSNSEGELNNNFKKTSFGLRNRDLITKQNVEEHLNTIKNIKKNNREEIKEYNKNKNRFSPVFVSGDVKFYSELILKNSEKYTESYNFIKEIKNMIKELEDHDSIF